MHGTMLDYVKSLESGGHTLTASCYAIGLSNFQAWLDTRNLDPLKATQSDLEAFQRHLAEGYRSPRGLPLGRGTQATRLSAVKAYYAWMYLHGVLLFDPARKIVIPKVSKGFVKRDHLSQQEAIALLQTQAKRCASRYREGNHWWATEQRNLAMLCLAIATGRRRRTLLSLKVSNLDFERDEVRVEREKGKFGRVLPCARWAMSATKAYLEKARPSCCMAIPMLANSSWASGAGTWCPNNWRE